MHRDPLEQAEFYERHIFRTGLSEATQAVYAARVRAFCEWLAGDGDGQYAEALSDEHVRDYAVRDYRRKLLTVDKHAPATVAQHMTALGSFYEYLELGRPNVPPIESAPSDRSGLDEDELRKVLRAAKRRGARDFALLCVLAYAGLRVAEAAALDTDDVLITERTGVVAVRYGKGGKPRPVPIGPDTRAAVREWLAERRHLPGADTPALWLSRGGKRMAARSIQHVVSEVGDAVGIPLHPHKLRHTYGRLSVNRGTDLVELQTLMGHKDVRTTAGYAKPSQRDLEAAAERVEIDL